MLPLTKNRRFRIPNRLAIFAAFLLAVTSLAGLGGSAGFMNDGASQVSIAKAQEESPNIMRSSGVSKVNSKKGFKVSLFLFRNH